MAAGHTSRTETRWSVVTDDPTALSATIDWRDGVATATLRAERAVTAAAAVLVRTPHSFGVAMYERGIVQHVDDAPRWAASPTALRRFYTMDRETGSTLVAPAEGQLAFCEWGGPGAGVWLVGAGESAAPREGETDGEFSLEQALRPERLAAGEERTVVFRVTEGDAAVTEPEPGAFDLPTEADRLAHSLALWGSVVPSLGSLEIRGSAYPTINLPERTYGPRHTFFDPDAWNPCGSLSYSGVPELVAEARDTIELALAHITDDGLVPHHFEGEEPTYVAISGSPQPGPNLFMLEAAIDHACATGDLAWLASAWERGLRRATAWLLNQLDPEVGLLHVVGALWVDVFRRAGFTLDTNAMAVRTFARVAELAELAGDELAPALRSASETIRHNLQTLWAGDHFVTSRGRGDEADDDHVDIENYLAVAVGATTPEQTAKVFELFDGSPLTHPGGRGTWVSLRRYDEEDCYLGNTGDSETAMARLLWADLLARRAVGDREGFMRLYENVRGDLLRLVWMNERYSADGEMIRAPGYHEYPAVVDAMLRWGVYGLSLDLLAVEVKPMIEGPFAVRLGEVSVEHSPQRVRLAAPGEHVRAVSVHGLPPTTAYRWDGGLVTTDADGVLRLEAAIGHGLALVRQG